MEVVRTVFNRTVKPPYVLARGLVDRTLERRAGIRTSGRVSLEELGLSPTDRVHYEPAHWLALRRILSVREIDSDDVFIDLGSGMGRIVFQAAARYPFRRVIGVEISDVLHAISIDNIARNRHRLRCTDVQLVCADALDYEISDDVTVVYLGNPFLGAVFSSVLDRLVDSVRRNPRRLRLIYANPVEEEMVLAAGFRRTKTLRGMRPGKEWSRSNSTRRYEFGLDGNLTNAPDVMQKTQWR